MERNGLAKLAKAIKNIDIMLWCYADENEYKKVRQARRILWDLIHKDGYILSTSYRLKKEK